MQVPIVAAVVAEMLQRESIALQKGMNFRVRGGAAGYSIILMSIRKGAPYQDQWHDEGSPYPHAGMLEYEGHDLRLLACHYSVGWPIDSKIDPSCGLIAIPSIRPDGSFRWNHCS